MPTINDRLGSIIDQLWEIQQELTAASVPPILPPPEGGNQDTALVVPVSHPRIFFQDPARLARAQAAFAANPITTWRTGLGEPAGEFWKRLAAAMLAPEPTAPVIVELLDDLRSFSIPESHLLPTSNGSDVYRNNYWFPVAYDWLCGYLTITDRDVIRERYTSYVLAIREQSWGGPDMPENNYFWANFHNEILWALAIYHEDRVTADSLLNYALTVRWPAFVAWARGEGRGGLPGDGSSYGRDQLNLITLPILALRELGTDLVPDAEEWLCGAMYRLAYDTGAGPTMRKGGSWTQQIFPYHDQEKDGGYPQTDERMGSFAALIAELWPDSYVGDVARWWLGFVQQAEPHWRYGNAGGPLGDVSRLPTDYYCPGPGFLYSGLWTGSTRCVFELGLPFSAGHRHICPGNFAIRYGGEYLVKENTGYSADRAHQFVSGDPLTSTNHQGMAFNGQGMCDVGWTDPIATVKRLHVTPDWAFAAVDLTNAYHSERLEQHNANVRQHVREFFHLKQPGVVVTLDRYERTTASVVASNILHFPERPEIIGPGRVRARNTNQELLIYTLVPAAPSYTIVDEASRLPVENRDSDGGFYQWTLLTEDTGGDAFGYCMQVLCAGPVDGPEPTVTLAEDAVSWTLRIGTDVLVIAKGPDSVGGTVNGVPLRVDVEEIRVTPDGVAWV